MRKVVIGILVCLMMSCLLVGCGGKNKDNEPGNGPEKAYVEITFCQQGEENVIKTIEKGESLLDVPTPKSKTGYTIVWDRTDFNNIDSDITVNAVATAKKYKMVLDYVLYGVAGDKEIQVEYDKTYALPTPTSSEATFVKWVKNGTTEEVTSGTYKTDEDLYLTAVWNEPGYTGRH